MVRATLRGLLFVTDEANRDQAREIMVFQSYAVWPHMTVYQNVAFPLVNGPRKYSTHDVKKRVLNALELVQLGGLADRPAPFLSGGQQQRVALARALAVEPKVLLMRGGGRRRF